MKHTLQTLGLSYALALAAPALAAGPAHAATGDSTHYLTVRDTVMLEIAPNKVKYTRHTLAPKQTLYSLSRFYAQDIDQVYELNPELARRSPRAGEAIKVAVPNVAITRFRDKDFSRWRFARVCYAVQPGETMYHIARTVFRMPVDTLMALNGLAGHDLSPGQVLQVGWMSLDGAARHVRPRELNPLRAVNAGNAQRYAQQTAAADARPVRRGVASWTPGSGDASGQLFALYAGAQPGTYLKVSNPANGAHAYVRVIGTPPDNVREDRVDILLSGTTARVLGASDLNFYVAIQ